MAIQAYYFFTKAPKVCFAILAAGQEESAIRGKTYKIHRVFVPEPDDMFLLSAFPQKSYSIHIASCDAIPIR